MKNILDKQLASQWQMMVVSAKSLTTSVNYPEISAVILAVENFLQTTNQRLEILERKEEQFLIREKYLMERLCVYYHSTELASLDLQPFEIQELIDLSLMLEQQKGED
jgi:hypothetical protein